MPRTLVNQCNVLLSSFHRMVRHAPTIIDVWPQDVARAVVRGARGGQLEDYYEFDEGRQVYYVARIDYPGKEGAPRQVEYRNITVHNVGGCGVCMGVVCMVRCLGAFCG